MRLTNRATQAVREAKSLSALNGAPVGVLVRDGWYRVEEDAEAFEDLQDEGWQEFAMVYEPADVED